MADVSLTMSLALVTLVLVLGFGLWQWYRASRAKAERPHSAMTEGHPELRKPNSPGVERP